MLHKLLGLMTTLLATVGVLTQPVLGQIPTSRALALATPETSVAQIFQNQGLPLLAEPIAIARMQADPAPQGELALPNVYRLEPESPLPNPVFTLDPEATLTLTPGPVPTGTVGPAYDRGIQVRIKIN